MNIEIKDKELFFAKVRANAIIPCKKDENAGYDIYPCFEEDYIIILPHETKLIPTGIASAFYSDYYIQIQERGSTGSKGIKYGAGVIDSGYRGEWFIAITNANDVPIIIINEEDEHKFGEIKIGNWIIYYSEKSNKIESYFKYDLSTDILNESKLIIYPKNKAIAQAIVHKVPKLNVQEISFNDLQNIPSERKNGKLGSSGK